MTDLRTRLTEAIDAEGITTLTPDQRQCLINGILSELAPDIADLTTKLREANKERGKISTRLYITRLEHRETQNKLRRMHHNQGFGLEHQQRLLRLLRDLMHAIDPSRPDGPLIEDLDHCLKLAQRHRHEIARNAQT